MDGGIRMDRLVPICRLRVWITATSGSGLGDKWLRLDYGG